MSDARVTRRDFFKRAGLTGLTAAASPLSFIAVDAKAAAADGTPEQIHLTFGNDTASNIFVSWACAAQAINPRVIVDPASSAETVVHAVQRTYTDGLSGQTVFTYHAELTALKPGTTVRYEVTADNDSNRDKPFASSFQAAPQGRAAFRWTSYGDLATPVVTNPLGSLQSQYAVEAVEKFAPLFHLLNGDLCYANFHPESQPPIWAAFGANVQASAAHRPWMPCPGNHEIEFCNGSQGFESYLTRYSLPSNGTVYPGRWYSFQVGSALFVSLSGDDVAYQDGGPMVEGPAAFHPARSTGNDPIEPGTSFYIHGYSEGQQTLWLENTLSAASKNDEIDWIIVQMHQDALSSAENGNGSDAGIRKTWLPIFDRYGVDLVLCGHDHDYERSWPVRGCNHDAGHVVATGAVVDTWQPKPVVDKEPSDGEFDTRLGTIHLILGGGGTSFPSTPYGTDKTDGLPQAKVITKANRPIPGKVSGTFSRAEADAREDAIWSARRDTETGFGIAVFDLDPGVAGGKTSITIRYYHAPGANQTPTSTYELFETVVLAKDR